MCAYTISSAVRTVGPKSQQSEHLFLSSLRVSSTSTDRVTKKAHVAPHARSCFSCDQISPSFLLRTRGVENTRPTAHQSINGYLNSGSNIARSYNRSRLLGQEFSRRLPTLLVLSERSSILVTFSADCIDSESFEIQFPTSLLVCH